MLHVVSKIVPSGLCDCTHLIFIYFQLANAGSDKDVQAVFLEDDVLDVLDTIGYRGVPQRQSFRSAQDIVRQE